MTENHPGGGGVTEKWIGRAIFVANRHIKRAFEKMTGVYSPSVSVPDPPVIFRISPADGRRFLSRASSAAPRVIEPVDDAGTGRGARAGLHRCTEDQPPENVVDLAGCDRST